jgi:hypothetical protein
VKAIPVMALLAALRFVAGCGSGSKVGSDLSRGTKFATFTKVKGGAVIRCPGGEPTATVPDRQTYVTGSSYVVAAKGSHPSGSLRAVRSKSGLLRVACTP